MLTRFKVCAVGYVKLFTFQTAELVQEEPMPEPTPTDAGATPAPPEDVEGAEGTAPEQPMPEEPMPEVVAPPPEEEPMPEEPMAPEEVIVEEEPMAPEPVEPVVPVVVPTDAVAPAIVPGDATAMAPGPIGTRDFALPPPAQCATLRDGLTQISATLQSALESVRCHVRRNCIFSLS
jgi:hypothetical protein